MVWFNATPFSAFSFLEGDMRAWLILAGCFLRLLGLNEPYNAIAQYGADAI